VTKHPIKIFSKNFRGFRQLNIDLNKTLFLVGDNSSGKSSILHLINAVLRNDLNDIPALDEDLSVFRYDYFSPYFDNADVTLGYEYANESNRFGKFITIKHSPKGSPRVVLSSVFDNNTVASIKAKAKGKGLQRRLVESESKLSIDEVIEIHERATGFENVRGLNDLPPPNHPFALMTAFDLDALKETRVLQTIFAEPIPTVRHVSPLRGMPERYYLFRRTIEAKGSHFAAMWQDLKEAKKKEIFAPIHKFGQESGLFEEVDVRRISRSIADSPLAVTVKKQGKDFLLNQVGVGVSQVVPILVECVFSDNDSYDPVLLLQQPELHLHPVAQSALGSFLYSMAARGQPLCIETHSNFLIDRFRSEIRDSETNDIDASIYYCENTESGNQYSEIRISNDGRLIDPPLSYFEFFISELSRTMF
jgi:predicted ATPase